MILEDISRKRRARTRQQQISESIQYRQNMRDVNNGKRRIEKLIEDYSSQAVAAERDGDHKRAVQLALEAKRLKRYLATSGGISAALESAHAVTTANRALANILDASSGLMGQAIDMMDPAALGEAQANMVSVNENVRLMMEQSDMMLEGMTDDDDGPDEGGEELLRQIMRSEHREKHDKLIRDTNRQLDRLQRARAAEK